MNQNQQQTLQLPDRVTLGLATQQVATILGALHDAGPYKVVFPIVRDIEQQLMTQQIPPKYVGPPPGAPEQPATVSQVAEETAHHPV